MSEGEEASPPQSPAQDDPRALLVMRFEVEEEERPDDGCCAAERLSVRRGLDDPSSSWCASVFQFVVIALILVSTLTSILVTVESLGSNHSGLFTFLEQFFTLAFTFEICIRVFAVAPKFSSYFCSVAGVVDIVATLPWYIEVLYFAIVPHNDQLPEIRNLGLLRMARLVRMLRLVKAIRHSEHATIILHALQVSASNLLMLVMLVVAGAILSATAIYSCEAHEDYPSIPVAMWWALTTMTTVGYGDITPKSALGRFIGAATMVGGILMISLAMAVVTTSFTEEYARKTDALQAKRMLSKAPNAGASRDSHRIHQRLEMSTKAVTEKIEHAEGELLEAIQLIEELAGSVEREHTTGNPDGWPFATLAEQRRRDLQTKDALMSKLLRSQTHSLFTAAKGLASAAGASAQVTNLEAVATRDFLALPEESDATSTTGDQA